MKKLLAVVLIVVAACVVFWKREEVVENAPFRVYIENGAVSVMPPEGTPLEPASDWHPEAR